MPGFLGGEGTSQRNNWKKKGGFRKKWGGVRGVVLRAGSDFRKGEKGAGREYISKERRKVDWGKKKVSAMKDGVGRFSNRTPISFDQEIRKDGRNSRGGLQ